MWTGADHQQALTLEPKSLLRWTNPEINRVYGDVFLWTLDGRPEFVMSVFKVWDPPEGLLTEIRLQVYAPSRDHELFLG